MTRLAGRTFSTPKTSLAPTPRPSATANDDDDFDFDADGFNDDAANDDDYTTNDDAATAGFHDDAANPNAADGLAADTAEDNANAADGLADDTTKDDANAPADGDLCSMVLIFEATSIIESTKFDSPYKFIDSLVSTSVEIRASLVSGAPLFATSMDVRSCCNFLIEYGCPSGKE